MKSEKFIYCLSLIVVLGAFFTLATVEGTKVTTQPNQLQFNNSSAVSLLINNKDLVFDDEFNGSTVDQSKWSTCYDWRLPSETGCTNDGNLEQEWYTPQQVTEQNGSLLLTAKKQPIDVAVQNRVKTFEFQSGMINTGRGSTTDPIRWAGTYGYYEARIKFTKGQGAWPAFWLLPINKQWPPEIDAMEFLGGKSNEILQTVHWQQNGLPVEDSQVIKGQDFSGDWHTYGVDWEPGKIDWYIDGVKTRSFAGQEVPSQPMEIILDLAIGGTLPKNADSTTPFPQGMQVDYVRAYQTKDQIRPSQY